MDEQCQQKFWAWPIRKVLEKLGVGKEAKHFRQMKYLHKQRLKCNVKTVYSKRGNKCNRPGSTSQGSICVLHSYYDSFQWFKMV